MGNSGALRQQPSSFPWPNAQTGGNRTEQTEKRTGRTDDEDKADRKDSQVLNFWTRINYDILCRRRTRTYDEKFGRTVKRMLPPTEKTEIPNSRDDWMLHETVLPQRQCNINTTTQ
eukprot:scaffold180_cov311-Pinguiococcus_pyrenoidosus.AAC.56